MRLKPEDFNWPHIHSESWRLAGHLFYREYGRSIELKDKLLLMPFIIYAFNMVIESKNKTLNIAKKIIDKENKNEM